MMATLVHELRTPLNGMVGMTQVLLAHEGMSEAQQRQLRLIESCGSHQLTLINDILDFCLLGEKRLQIKSTTTPMRPLIQSIVAAQKPFAEACRAQLSVHVADAVPHSLLVDATRLRQVLDNLISNAIKYAAGRTVSLWVEAPRRGDDPVDPRTLVRFTVHDTGLGMSATQLANVGRLFERGARDGSDLRTGHGIGLYVTHELLGLMGGRLQLSSVEGAGTRASFELRCQATHPMADAIERHDTPPSPD